MPPRPSGARSCSTHIASRAMARLRRATALSCNTDFLRLRRCCARRTRAMSDAQIFGIISNGSGAMPSYAAQVARDDRWKAILHVRKLQAQ